MEKKMEELLEKSNRSTRKATSLRYDDMCMHPNLDLPEGFKIPKFEMFNGTENPQAHLRSYCDQLVGVKEHEPLSMRLFSHSLTGEAAEWFTTQDMRQWHTWEDMAKSFMETFRFNVKILSDRYYLEKVKHKLSKNYREFASRAEAACVEPPMCEGELVSVFIRSQVPYFYDRMLSMAGKPFAELVKMEEAIEDGLKSEKIVSVFNKASGQTPNVNTNSLPNNGNNGVHMIERNEDWEACRALIPIAVKSLEHTMPSLTLQERLNFKVLVPVPRDTKVTSRFRTLIPAPVVAQATQQIALTPKSQSLYKYPWLKE
ncbi:uncharacterized protein LOC132613178 [Lycium barbarum]|uniref:uncharacterized protein LOC132613178 n=1 Tax=Lycium barbarum TaxID=112863 RepID=UPI00293E200E|nr:uncharacterized protein LOC132613178 [Lycium barbarum]